MTTYDYLIIGGGIAGTTAADTIRRADETASIAIIDREAYRLYSRIMLSKPPWFHGKIPFDRIFLRSEDWYEKQKVTLLTGTVAKSLDPARQVVTLEDGSELGYGKLLLSVGAAARPWGVPGCDKKNIFPVRTLEHGKGLVEAAMGAKRAVLVGGGFITFEVADLLRAKGIEVTVLLRENYYWEPTLDEAQGRMIEDALKKGGAKIIYQAEVSEVLGEEAVTGVRLKDGTEVPADLVVCGIGVVCELDWLKSSGLAVNKGILADEFLKTNLPDVWTAGDVAEYTDIVLEETVLMGSWANAQKQGEVAAQNMLGRATPFAFVSSYASHGFDTNVAFVGDVRALPGREIIARGSPSEGYGRIIAEKGELVGASLMNRNQDIAPLKTLIERNVKVVDIADKLKDASVDLNALLV